MKGLHKFGRPHFVHTQKAVEAKTEQNPLRKQKLMSNEMQIPRIPRWKSSEGT